MRRANYLALMTLSAAALAAVPSAQGSIILNDNFDSYANQAAFLAAWPLSGTGTTTVGATNSGSLDTSVANSAPNSINYPTEAGHRNNHSFTDTAATASNDLDWSFRFYDSNGAGAAYREYSELIDGAASASGQIIALGLNNNIASASYMARILGVDGGTGTSAFFKLDGAGVPTRSTGWHQLEATIHTSSVDFYVDGVFSKNIVLGGTAAGRLYDTVRMGSNLSSTSSANFDDQLVQTVAVAPEPATAGLLAVAACGGLLRRSRRQR
jgi:hypothetical protein